MVGIVAGLLLAYLVSYALEQWLEQQIPLWVATAPAIDGSTLNTSRYLKMGPPAKDTLNTPSQTALLSFYRYLDQGGATAYRAWREAEQSLSRPTQDGALVARALRVAGNNNAGKYLSLLLLVTTLLLLYGGLLREQLWSSPLLYGLIFLGTAYLYGALTAPFFTILIGVAVLFYLGTLRLGLPIYHSEWTRMMRPGLTLCCFLLATMVIRGPELVDYWFWTSQLYRFGLVLVLLWTLFFHLSILTHVLQAANMDAVSRTFAYGMPLGMMLIVLGLVIGLHGQPGEGLAKLNYELVALPVVTLAQVGPNQPFILFFVGTMLLILGGIGYFIRRISQ